MNKIHAVVVLSLVSISVGIGHSGTAVAQQEIPTRRFGLRELEGKKQIIWIGGGDFHDTARYYALQRHYLETEEKLPVFITYSEEPSVFTRLDAYDAVIMSHQLRNMTDAEEEALLRTVRGGKKVVALHAVTAAFKRSTPVRDRFHALVGGRFARHPAAQEFSVHVADGGHPIMEGIADFTIFDEFYTFEAIQPDRRVLLTGQLEGTVHPLAWVRPEGKGAVFYLALGHGNEANANPSLLHILKNAVLWALQ